MSRAYRVVITLLLMGGVLWYVGGFAGIARAFAGVDIVYVACAAGAMTLDRITMTWKWALLLRSQRQTLPLIKGVKIYCAAMIWGMFLPSTVGADAIRALLTSRAGLDLSTVTASIVIERMIGFLSSLLLGLASLFLLQRLQVLDDRYDHLFLVGIAALAVSTALFAVSFTRSWYDRLMTLLPVGIQGSHVVRKITGLHRTYRAYAASKRLLLVFFGLTFVQQFFPIVSAWLLALAFGADVNLLFLVGVIPLTLLISRLPVSLDGIGVYESAFAALMALAGVPPALAVGIALVGRMVTLAALAPWWIAYMMASRQFKPTTPNAAQV